MPRFDALVDLARQHVQRVQLLLEFRMRRPLFRKILPEFLAERDVGEDAVADVRDKIERVAEVVLNFLPLRLLLAAAVDLASSVRTWQVARPTCSCFCPSTSRRCWHGPTPSVLRTMSTGVYDSDRRLGQPGDRVDQDRPVESEPLVLERLQETLAVAVRPARVLNLAEHRRPALCDPARADPRRDRPACRRRGQPRRLRSESAALILPSCASHDGLM